jgi:(1->4)-alpha-D-glucan 1-alpha-D-glucosylmutase
MRQSRKRIPIATHRLQLNRGCTFENVLSIIEYLHELGISDCYLSPIQKARLGSPHGYDVIDYDIINPELGGEENLERLVTQVDQRNMGLIIDIVPNHMCIADPGNHWWNDVLRNGRNSPYAGFFDICWQSGNPRLENKVLLAILEEELDDVLRKKALEVVFTGGAFFCRYRDELLPLSPSTQSMIIGSALKALKEQLGESHQDVLDAANVAIELSRNLSTDSVEKRLADLVDADEYFSHAITESLRELNDNADRLKAILGEQAYSLAYWRRAPHEINYRRFFDINDLVGLRVEDPVVFEAVHRKIVELVARGWIAGLRVDHLDGLFDPVQYLANLQQACRSAVIKREEGLESNSMPSRSDDDNKPFFIVVEKILQPDEQVRSNWLMCGTTGYEFLNRLNELFVHPAGLRKIQETYRKFASIAKKFDTVLYDSRKLILREYLSSDLTSLARLLHRALGSYESSTPPTFEQIKECLLEIIACFPVYRTYIRSMEVTSEDRNHVLSALHFAKKRNTQLPGSLFDLIASAILMENLKGVQRQEQTAFAMRFQQLTVPVMAKGFEDTALYRFYPLASLNEVGGDPENAGTSLEDFHRMNQYRAFKLPHAMSATSTHDTKRGEDVRARINVLSEMAEEWEKAVYGWTQLNSTKRKMVEGGEAPDRNEEYLLYQTLIGTWPNSDDTASHIEYVKRIQDYMVKALREAKVHSTWVNPNALYEKYVSDFVEAILQSSPKNQFPGDFSRFERVVADIGVLNSLSQTLLKITSPGVPDFYQGTETWDFSLVDPDNRRPVNYAKRIELLSSLGASHDVLGTAFLDELMREWRDGRIKLYVINRALLFRKANNELFAEGEYLPMETPGTHRERVCAFARTLGEKIAITVAARWFMGLATAPCLPIPSDAWKDTALVLDHEIALGRYRDIFTGRIFAAEQHGDVWTLELRDVLSHLTVALLERVE